MAARRTRTASSPTTSCAPKRTGLETYRPEQLALGTGGPKELSLLSTLADLREELSPLELVIAREVNRDIHEGRFHDGPSATVQIVGVRPA